MQGRLENEMRLQKTTDEIMKTMPKFAEEWYTNMKASKKTASSIQDYSRKIRKFLEYISDDIKNMSPDEITLQACESYMIMCQTKTKTNGLVVYTSDSYQYSVWCALNSLLKFLKKRNYISYNFMEDIDRPKNQDLDRVNNERVLLTQRDFQKILRNAKEDKTFMNGKFNNRDVLIILLFMTTGMRKTALSEINLSDINFMEGTLTVIDKGNKMHVYSLSDQVIEYLNKWLIDRTSFNAQSDALLINRYGTRMLPKGIYDVVKKNCKEALGKELSPHKLRSGFCSILYNKTHDVEFVRRVVGHSNIQTTQRYIKTDDKEKEKAVQIMGDILNV